ncbi:MAG: HAMP domain-containing sensor histidine kinase, partial [Elusimicrobiota bacterium]
MKLRVRISLVILGLMLLGLVFFSVAYYTLEHGSELARIQRRAGESVRLIASVCRQSAITGDWGPARRHLRSLSGEPEIRYADCLDGEERVLARSGDGEIGPRRSRVVVEGTWEVSRSMRLGDRGSGTARIGYDAAMLEAQVQERLLGMVWRMALVASVTLLFGLLAAVLVARSLTRPVEALAAATREISRGHLDYRLPVEDREDELGILARRFNEMAARLAELDRMKEVVVSSLTHDLKSPLAGVKGGVEALLERGAGPLSKKQSKYLESSRSASARMWGYLDDILTVMKMQGGSFPMKTGPVPVKKLVDSVLKDQRLMAKEGGIRLEAALNTGLPSVRADRDLIRRVLENLVS